MTVLLFSKSNTTPQKIRRNYGGLENDVTFQMKDLQMLFSDFAHVLTIRFPRNVGKLPSKKWLSLTLQATKRSKLSRNYVC